MIRGACAWIVGSLAFAGLAFSQTAAAPPASTPPGTQAPSSGVMVPQGVLYKDGQLTIDILDGTLVEILRRVSVLTGIRIDIPMEANGERIPMIKLGPGTACDVLASLLRETHFNFLIAASDSASGKLQSVLIMPMDSKETTASAREPMPEPPPPHRSTGAPLEQQASSESAATEMTASNAPSQTSSDSTASASGSADAPAASLAAAVNPSDLARPAALSPPPVLNQQTISQQLQQMYQQRMQMVQQSRQSTSAGPAAN